MLTLFVVSQPHLAQQDYMPQQLLWLLIHYVHCYSKQQQIQQ